MLTQTVIVQDTATPTLVDMLGRMRDRSAVNAVAGRAGANLTRDWLRRVNDARPNRLGGKRTNFFAKAAAATGSETDAEGAIVYTAATGILYQRYGGTIKPSGRTSTQTGKPIKHLAIPARAEAHGMLPSDFNSLVPVIRRRNGKPTVIGLEEPVSQAVSFGKVRKDGTRNVKQGAVTGGAILFWLVDQATKGPDEDVLPPPSLVGEAVNVSVLAYITRNAGRLV